MTVTSETLDRIRQRDSRIYMDEPTHIYYLDGCRRVAISGTGFLHLFFEPFDVKKVTEELSAKAKAGSAYHGKSADEISKMWTAGTASGSRMHKNIEEYWNAVMMSETSDNFNTTRVEDYGLFAQFLTWFRRTNLRPFRTEWMIYDEEYDIAGSIDFVAYNPTTDKYWVIDWKRSNRLRRESYKSKKGLHCCDTLDDCNGNHYQLQVNLYQHILEKNYGIKIEQCVVVNLHPVISKMDMLVCDDLQDTIRSMLEYWMANKERLTNSTSRPKHEMI